MRTVGKLEMALASILQVEPCRRNHFGCWTANLVGWSPENMRHALCDCHWLLEVLQTHNMQRCFSWFDITNTCLKNAWFNGLIDICMWGGCLTIWNQKMLTPPATYRLWFRIVFYMFFCLFLPSKTTSLFANDAHKHVPWIILRFYVGSSHYSFRCFSFPSIA